MLATTCRLALLLVLALPACGEKVPAPGSGAVAGSPPPGGTPVAGSPSPTVSATTATPTTVPPSTVPPTPTATAGTVTMPPVKAPTGPAAFGAATYEDSELLYYRGRTYFAIAGETGTSVAGGIGTPPTSAAFRPGQAVGQTFSRWQSNGQFPAGTRIYSVAGVPVEQMLAVQAGDRTHFFGSDGRPAGLDTTQVVLGTVRSFGPARWSTPDGRAPARPVAVLYTPAIITVEQILRGSIPTGTAEIEVRQRRGVDTTSGMSIPGVLPLTPGDRMLLFLYPGQWSLGRSEDAPPGDYYWALDDWLYRIDSGQVAPLAAPDGSEPAVPLDTFRAAVDEVFRGVKPLALDGPRPTPLPTQTPAPTPTPRFAVGQTINVVKAYQLDQTESIALKGGKAMSCPCPTPRPIDARAVVATLDRPLPVLAVGDAKQSGYPPPDPLGTGIYFNRADGSRSSWYYTPKVRTLTNTDDYHNPITVPAPAEFVRLLGLED